MEPFAHYLVNSDWILNLVQQRKMSYEDARAEMIKTVKGLPPKLASFDVWNKEQRQAALRSHIAGELQELDAPKWPFRNVDAVISWLGEFDTLRHLYRFLVLEGPGQVGKTQYARSLSLSPEPFLEVVCMAATEPHLSGFVELVHDTILFDEASPMMAIRCKKLFQAGVGWVTLGQSSTNCHAYSLWPFRVKMIVCSNKWSSQVAADLSAEDQECIQLNCVYCRVTSPLFLQDPGLCISLDVAPASAVLHGIHD